VLDDGLRGVNAEKVQFIRGTFQLVHFARSQFIAGRLVPVRSIVVRVKGEAHALHFGAPVRSRLTNVSFHVRSWVSCRRCAPVLSSQRIGGYCINLIFTVGRASSRAAPASPWRAKAGPSVASPHRIDPIHLRAASSWP